MDRVILSKEETEELFRWRDEHEDLVRTLPCPLKAVEIIVGKDVRIKAIRDKTLTLYAYLGTTNLLKMVCSIVGDKVISHKKKTIIPEEEIQSLLSCYCSLMAFMTYERPELVERTEQHSERKPHEPRRRPAKKPIAYILRRRVAPTESHGGHHASPKGVFTVRGHYRHYRNGKIVWISEYKKGEGKNKSKTYKIGARKNGTDSIDDNS